MILYEMASTVAGFLQVHDIKKLMKTCKRIRRDKQVMNALVAQYKARLHPATDASDCIKNMIGIQSTRVYRIYTECGHRSANMYLGPPEPRPNLAFFSIHFQHFLYTFNVPEGPFMEDGRASEVPVASLVGDTVVGLFFRTLDVQEDGMHVVFVVNRTLVLHAHSHNCYAIPREPYVINL